MQNYIITLQPGWNQIGNPFAFPVNWSEVIKRGNIENRLVGFGGSTNDASGYDYTRTQLVPFEGYFVNNLESQPATIEVPPRSATGSAARKQNESFLVGRQLQSNEWALQITATTDRYFDKDNHIGWLNDADDAWDANDFSEATFFADLVSLYFPHPEWKTYPGKYTGDFRTINAEGGVWDFEVRTTQTRVSLAVAERLNAPEDWEVVLLDKSGQIAWDFHERAQYTFVMATNAPVHAFSIVVGKSDFVEKNDLDLPSVPQAFALSQNYPNPFNPETRLNYELPTASQLKITIHNLQGQEIQTLIEGPKRAGRHTVSWDGTNHLGDRAGSGVYFVRMEAEGFIHVRKLVLAR